MARRKTETEIVIPPGRLWPDTPWGQPMSIEVFGATGEFATGKTILGLSIAPGVHPPGHAFEGQPRTLYLDLEKSGASYAGTGCKRIDVPAEMTKVYGPDWTAKNVAEWFNSVPARVNPGQYDVCHVDPINDIEAGEVDIVKANPTAYGYSKGQIDNSVPLLMAAMKAHYKKLLMAFAGAFKCLYFTTHLRDEFKGGKPTSRREPRGKETLAELASLYLWLERLPDENGKQSPVPSAIVLKHRLSDTRVNETGQLEVVELMPRRIPVATVRAIRQYIANPPNIDKPAAGEQVIEKPITEIEVQRTRLAVAEAEANAANARSSLLERQKELAAIRSQPRPEQTKTAPVPAVTEPVDDRAAEKQRLAELQQQGEQLMAAAPPEHQSSIQSNESNGRIERFKALMPICGISATKIMDAMLRKGTGRFSLLSEQDQDALLAVLQKAADKRAAETAAASAEKN